MSTAVKFEDGDQLPKPHEAKLSSKNQITIPVAALAAANVKAGDRLRVQVVGDGEFRVTRVRDPFWEAFEELAGSAPGITEAANLEELRNEWER